METVTVTVEQIAQEAFAAASKATAEYLAKYGDGYPCGFAWCTTPATGKFAKYLKDNGLARKHHGEPGLVIWNPAKTFSQNVDAIHAGTSAFAEVLRKHGIKSSVGSRWD